MTAFERAFVDTNVLVYAAFDSESQHVACRELLRSPEFLCASPQVFAEFYAVVTNRRRVASPFAPGEARRFILDVLPRFEILPIPGLVISQWVDWAGQFAITGGDIFDAQIVATMLASGVRKIYTYNHQDFERYPGLAVVSPDAVTR
jgi:predicted nucleic acid-binding protein